MEILGGIVLSLMLMVLLAGVGLVTVAGLALMIILGLLTNMSFKRLFFVSFGLGLLAPLLLAGVTIAAIEDGSLQRELRQELGGVVTLPDDMGENWEGTLDEMQRIGREVEDGTITEEQAKERFKELFGGEDGLPLRLESGEDDASDAEESAVTVEAQ